MSERNDINMIVSRLPRRTATSIHIYIAQCQDTHHAQISDEYRLSARWPPTRCESAGRLFPTTSSITPRLPLFRKLESRCSSSVLWCSLQDVLSSLECPHNVDGNCYDYRTRVSSSLACTGYYKRPYCYKKF